MNAVLLLKLSNQCVLVSIQNLKTMCNYHRTLSFCRIGVKVFYIFRKNKFNKTFHRLAQQIVAEKDCNFSMDIKFSDNLSAIYQTFQGSNRGIGFLYTNLMSSYISIDIICTILSSSILEVRWFYMLRLIFLVMRALVNRGSCQGFDFFVSHN